jgi:hypothetical protein
MPGSSAVFFCDAPNVVSRARDEISFCRERPQRN